MNIIQICNSAASSGFVQSIAPYVNLTIALIALAPVLQKLYYPLFTRPPTISEEDHKARRAEYNKFGRLHKKWVNFRQWLSSEWVEGNMGSHDFRRARIRTARIRQIWFNDPRSPGSGVALLEDGSMVRVGITSGNNSRPSALYMETLPVHDSRKREHNFDVLKGQRLHKEDGK